MKYSSKQVCGLGFCYFFTFLIFKKGESLFNLFFWSVIHTIGRWIGRNYNINIQMTNFSQISILDSTQFIA